MQLTFEGVSENEKSPTLISPYGGNLVDLVASEEERAFLIARASVLSSVQLSERAVCDLELLATGAFSPLDRGEAVSCPACPSWLSVARTEETEEKS